MTQAKEVLNNRTKLNLAEQWETLGERYPLGDQERLIFEAIKSGYNTTQKLQRHVDLNCRQISAALHRLVKKHYVRYYGGCWETC